MAVRPYALLGDSMLAAARAAAGQALDAWCAGWGLPRAQVDVACERAWDQPMPHAAWWRRCYDSAGRAAWMDWPQDLAPHLQGMLFPVSRRDMSGAGTARVAAAGGEAAVRELADGLALALLGTPGAAGEQTPPPAQWRHGSGAVMLRVNIGAQHCGCLLNHAAVLALAARRGVKPAAALPALAPLRHADVLRHVPLSLEVRIGGAQVGLGSLIALGVGDVVRLDTLADQPLSVCGPNGRTLLQGYLGTQHHAIALEIVRGTPLSGVRK